MAKAWQSKWHDYVDKPASPKEDRAPPGPVFMNCECQDENEFVGELVWEQYVSWYGLDESHQLDRECDIIYSDINQSQQGRREFSICVFSPYIHVIKHRSKTLDTRDVIGYLENQLRRIFKVPHDQKSRLWVSDAEKNQYEVMLDRNLRLGEAYNIRDDKTYIIAIEITSAISQWQSCIPGDAKGNLCEAFVKKKYPQNSSFDHHLKGTFHALTSFVTNVLAESSSHYSDHVKSIVNTKETQLDIMRNELNVRTSDIQDMYNTLAAREQMLREGEYISKIRLLFIYVPLIY